MILVIQPRRYTGKRLTWYVNVPKDLRAGMGQGRKKFGSKADAEAFAAKLDRKRKFRAFLKEFADFGAFHADIPGVAALSPNGKEFTPLTLDAAFDSVIASKKLVDRPNSLATLKCSLKSFAKACHKAAGDVLPADVEAWLYANDHTPKTRKGRHTDLNTAFGWLVKRRLIARNPVSPVDAPAVAFKKPEILSVDEIEKILRTCEKHDPALIGHIAMILWGGLRRGESARATKKNVIGGVIELTGDQTKLNCARNVKINETLEAWLAVAGVELGGKKLFDRMKAIQQISGVTIPQNALRHSASSYWRELIGGIESARLLGHSEGSQLKSYAAKVTPEEAKRFIELRPMPQNTQ